MRWYLHPALPSIRVGVRVDSCLGDTGVTLEVEAAGKTALMLSDPHLGGMAFSRDGTRLFLQTGSGQDRQDATLDLRTNARIADALHPSERAEIVLLTEFSDGDARLAPVGLGNRTGEAFQLTHPARTRAAEMSALERLALLDEALSARPDERAWAQVCGVFERWVGPSGRRGVEAALPRLASWPMALRCRPYWLDWLEPHPLWALIVAPESAVRLSGRYLGDEGVAPLLALPALSELEELSLIGCAIGPAGAQALAQTPSLSRLLNLCLYQNPIGDRGAGALAESPYLGALRDLHVLRTGMSREGVRALERSPRLRALARLTADASFPARAPKQPARPEEHALPGTHACVPGLDAVLRSGAPEVLSRALSRAVGELGGCAVCVQRLLEGGADANLRTDDGRTMSELVRAGVTGAVGADAAAETERVLRAAGASE
jgi:hypothetical protein